MIDDTNESSEVTNLKTSKQKYNLFKFDCYRKLFRNVINQVPSV